MEGIVFGDSEFINHDGQCIKNSDGSITIEGRINLYTESGDCYTGVVRTRVRK